MTAQRALRAVVLAASLAACDARPPDALPGYVEAEFVRVAAPVAGTLVRLDVQRGQRVAARAPLFALDSEPEGHARAEAEARLEKAQAALANLEKGRRAPEVAAVEAQLAQAQAALRASEATLERTRRLVDAKFVAPQQLDEAVAQRDRDRARVAELASQVQVARLPSRSDEIAAARAEARAAAEGLAQVRWRLEQKVQVAPQEGVVDDTLYRAGEWVAAGAPVVSLLPAGNVKVRFFVPEGAVADVRPGTPATVRCDGCGDPIPVVVDYVAPQAEFTPPVIYSRDQRGKLVFLVEARPATPVPALRPGLPVDVTLGR